MQVFDANGKFLKEFGQYGNKEGEFDCLAGVAVNRIGQFIIADRYNHRIQVRPGISNIYTFYIRYILFNEQSKQIKSKKV